MAERALKGTYNFYGLVVKKKTFWFGLVTFGGFVLIGIGLRMEHWAEKSDAPGWVSYFLLGWKFLAHLGTAFIVAVIVSGLYDTIYHDETFMEPLLEAKGEILHELTTLHDVLGTSISTGIVAVYDQADRKDQERLNNDIQTAIAGADKFIYFQGRALNTLLVRDDYGIADVETRLRKVEKDKKEKGTKSALKVRFCFANVFEHKTRGEGYTARRKFESGLGQARHDLSRILKLDRCGADVGLRLTRYAPTYGILMTETTMFIEYYLPHEIEGTVVVFKVKCRPKIGRREPLHDTYRIAFENSFADEELAEEASKVMNRFIKRREAEAERDGDAKIKTSKTSDLAFAEVKKHLRAAENWDKVPSPTSSPQQRGQFWNAVERFFRPGRHTSGSGGANSDG